MTDRKKREMYVEIRRMGLMTDSKEIEDLKIRWRTAMKQREEAIKAVNHYAELINEARRRRR